MSNKDTKFSYGVLHQNNASDQLSYCMEGLQNNGFCILENTCSDEDVATISQVFDSIKADYVRKWGLDFLQSIDEQDIVRLPMQYGLEGMLKTACNPMLLKVLNKVIDGNYILNQQNLITNPSQKEYSQSPWHRDLPYQHFVSTKPLAINALYCVDDFTVENGASFVIPFSHKQEKFPSENYITNNAIQLEAKAGSYIILDCMTFHRGGFNASHLPRRAINHVFTIPYFKQQISIPENIQLDSLPQDIAKILGVSLEEVSSIQHFFDKKITKSRG